jgi:hypothetical protein
MFRKIWEYLKERPYIIMSWFNRNKKLIKIIFSIISLFILIPCIYFGFDYFNNFFYTLPANQLDTLSLTDKFTEINKFEKSVDLKYKYAQILAGLGGIVLIIVQIIRTVKFSGQVKEQRRSNINSETLDQYIKAVDQLKDENIAVRLGGIYSLEKIMNSKDKEVQGYHNTIIELLCAYVREKRPFDEEKYSEDLKLYNKTEENSNNLKKYDVELETDLQAIITVLGRRNIIENEIGIDLSSTNLFNASLFKANLIDSNLRSVYLKSADLRESNLVNAYLWKGKLNSTLMDDCNLACAFLEDVDFENANIVNVNFNYSNLYNVCFENSILMFSNFENVQIIPDWSIQKISEKDIIKFAGELEKASDIFQIKLNDEFIKIIKNEFSDLYKRINEENLEKNIIS